MSVDRYLRQTILPEVGRAGQEKLASARVLCVGVGGLGSPAALYLAAAGVGHIGLMDPDRVDETNLQRQVIFQEADRGEYKALSAEKRLKKLNSSICIDALPEQLSAGNALSILPEYDVIVDGTDNFAAKYLINDAAVRVGRPVIYGSISRMEGQLSVFGAKDGPCYRCLYSSEPNTWVPNCAESGVLGAVAGVIGSMQAMEVIKVVLGLPTLTGKLLIWDALSMRSRTLALSRKPDCPTCSVPRESILLADSQLSCQTSNGVQSKVQEISAIELQKLLSDQLVQLFDVREIHEWRSGCIPSAQGFPLSLIQKGEKPKLDLSRPTVVYCQSGIRSRAAVEALLQSEPALLGKLSQLKGGLEFWPYELNHDEMICAR